MAFDEPRRREIFRKTAGRCHICAKTLCFNNYGKHWTRGAWHVDHSVPRARGGSDHLNNYLPACIACNLDKSDCHTRTARRRHGRIKAPLSKARQEKIRAGNATLLGIVGGLLGLAGGPIGVIAGAGLGAAIGHGVDPEKQ